MIKQPKNTSGFISKINVRMSVFMLSFAMWAISSHALAFNEPSSIQSLRSGFDNPSKQYYPETWFHLNGKNISKEGLSADLEAIQLSGMQGIQVFNKRGQPYPNVPQISILTPQWEDAIAHIADETERLGLNLTFQNCPGWSMAGGPWVPKEEAQRELVHSEFIVEGGALVNKELVINADYQTYDRNYQDVKLIAFKTPIDHDLVDLTPVAFDSNNKFVPWLSIIDKAQRTSYQIKPRKLHANPNFRAYQEQGIQPVAGEPTYLEVSFENAITLRSIEFPPVRNIFMDRQYPKTNINIKLMAKIGANWQEITDLDIPSTHWYDDQYPATLSVPETTATQFRLHFRNDPLFLEYIKFNSRAYLHNHEAKASKSSRNLQSDIEQEVHPLAVIDSKSVIDISEFMDASGKLTWQAPKGSWTIVRFGHVNMLRTNRPAEPEATGWETSKLDKEAIENHLRKGMMGNLMREGGPLDGHKVHGMLIDSWESYVPTWTMKKERLGEEFLKRRGYDMQAYMPATLGYIVDSVEVSNKFLRDLRETMDDLYVENFFEHFATVAHDMGSKVYTEGAVGETLPGDPLRYYGVSDFPMTEFWYPKAPSNQREAKPIFAAASAYHLYDKPFLAAEAATQLVVKWNESPKTIQYLINENFAKGVNHLVFHTFSHTPQMDVVPGSSFGGQIGFPLLRTQTWWKHTPAWMASLARAQYVLQQGEFVADILWYLGDEFDRHPFDTHPFPNTHKFDYLNAEILHSKVKVINGQLHVEGAGKYKVIMLRDSERMLLSTAKKLKQLVLQGAVILGNKPLDSPSLMDDERDLAELKKISDELWGEGKSGSKRVGKGRVYWGYELESVLDAESIAPDVLANEEVDIRWLHRTTPDAEIYYMSNQHDTALDVAVEFRDGAGRAEIWDIETGERYYAQLVSRDANSNKSKVLLQFTPHSSQFVVFNKQKAPQEEFKYLKQSDKIQLSTQRLWYQLHNSDKPTVSLRKGRVYSSSLRSFMFVNEQNSQHNRPLDNQAKQKHIKITRQQQSLDHLDWHLSFEPGWDAPETISMSPLQALDKYPRASIRHYSGSVEYKAQFTFDAKQDNAATGHTIIDLGDVYDIAELWINGAMVGTRFAAPYSFDVSDYIKQGNNQIRILVSNTWRNQLIYDNQRESSEKKTWTTNPPKTGETNLDPSGIYGPVSLIHVTQKDTETNPLPSSTQQTIPSKPNIVFIYTDDQAPWALGRSGNQQAITPNLDKLASQGMYLPNAYVTTPVCSPSRATLLTSQYGHELGILDWININPKAKTLTGHQYGLGLDTKFETWPEILQTQGYYNGLIGKWHLGTDDKHHPTQHGYNEFTGFLKGGTSTTNPVLEVNGVDTEHEGLTIDVLTDYALSFLEQQKTKAFVLSLHYRAPHYRFLPVAPDDASPFADMSIALPHPEYPDLNTTRARKLMREYLSSVKGIDRNVGRVLRRLDELNLSENTIVIFTSDHGYTIAQNGIWHKGNGYWLLNTPPQGSKNVPSGQRPNLFDNNLKVPTIVRWPGVIKADSVNHSSMSNLDWFPTLVSIAGGKASRSNIVRGQNYLPAFLDDNKILSSEYYATYSSLHQSLTHMRMYSNGDYKLIRDFKNPQRDEFYDLINDPLESTNLLAKPLNNEHAALVRRFDSFIRQKMQSTNDPVLEELLEL